MTEVGLSPYGFKPGMNGIMSRMNERIIHNTLAVELLNRFQIRQIFLQPFQSGSDYSLIDQADLPR
jgi:hypothetical protein